MKLLSVFIFMLFSPWVFAEPPTLTGTMVVSVKQGTIDADFKLSHLPKLNNYVILINSGMNIQYFRNEQDNVNYAYRKSYNRQFSFESFGYYLPEETGKGMFLPDTLNVKYTGKFPVISDMQKASDYGDWKGNIAFNGKTVRADGFQAAWYPVLYDVENDKYYDSLTYDINISCADCQSIYVNGSSPVSGTSGNFTSQTSVQLMLFAGDFDIAESNGSFFLNAGLSEQQMVEFGKLTSSFEHFYQDRLGIPYGENVVFIHTTPISKKNNWAFVTYPTIVTINHTEGGLGAIISDEKADWFKPYIAHEFGHYYFGTYRVFNSELGDMLTESFAEYLALKLTKALIGESIFKANVEKKLAALKDTRLTPVSAITSATDYGNRNLYVYTYAPLIWLLVEQKIGEEKMYLWMQQLLTTDAPTTNYDFVISTLDSVLMDNSLLHDIKTNVLAKLDIMESAELF
ncbi:hypothetical protein [Alteromonas gilva]|uniref:Peptidase M1 membrane alanine aminopeptidase domain-containing protein n=1 Tax=Alteromonas gilva TaxID=2987522 RepID=A0ABT5L0U0_9ALTE|nr:hypothetical protein [Alteromonas gilva]MDC8830660.1 hypothetical protein [Alteromonas gilva]